MTINKEESTLKNDDIIRFIRVALLRPEQIDVLIPQLTQMLICNNNSDANSENVQRIAKDHILSDEYLKQFIPLVEGIFSHKEIKRLIQFYNDPAVAKYFKNCGAVGPTIYSSFSAVITPLLLTEQ